MKLIRQTKKCFTKRLIEVKFPQLRSVKQTKKLPKQQFIRYLFAKVIRYRPLISTPFINTNYPERPAREHYTESEIYLGVMPSINIFLFFIVPIDGGIYYICIERQT